MAVDQIDKMLTDLSDEDGVTETPVSTGETETVKAETAAETQEESTTPDGTSEETEAEAKTKSNTTIRQMREAINQHKKDAEDAKETLNRIAKANGFDTHEAYMKHLDEEEVTKAASDKNIPPELEKELRELKALRVAAQEEKQKNEFFTRLNTFKTEQGLTEDDILDFAQKAQEQGINLVSTNMNLGLVYRALNFENIETKIREEEREKVLKEIKTQGKGATIPRTSGDGDAPKKSMRDLYKDLSSGIIG